MSMSAAVTATPSAATTLVPTASTAAASPRRAKPISTLAKISSTRRTAERFASARIKLRRRAFIGRRRAVAITAAHAAMLHAEHAARARIGVEPDDAAFGRHPFQTVMRVARFVAIRTVGIVERARIVPANLRKESVERLHIALRHAARLRGDGRNAHRHGGQKHQKSEPKHGFFYPSRDERRMNTASRVRSGRGRILAHNELLRRMVLTVNRQSQRP